MSTILEKRKEYSIRLSMISKQIDEEVARYFETLKAEVTAKVTAKREALTAEKMQEITSIKTKIKVLDEILAEDGQIDATAQAIQTNESEKRINIDGPQILASMQTATDRPGMSHVVEPARQ